MAKKDTLGVRRTFGGSTGNEVAEPRKTAAQKRLTTTANRIDANLSPVKPGPKPVAKRTTQAALKAMRKAPVIVKKAATKEVKYRGEVIPVRRKSNDGVTTPTFYLKNVKELAALLDKLPNTCTAAIYGTDLSLYNKSGASIADVRFLKPKA